MIAIVFIAALVALNVWLVKLNAERRIEVEPVPYHLRWSQPDS